MRKSNRKNTYHDYALNTVTGKYICPYCSAEYTKWAIMHHIWFKHGKGQDHKWIGHLHDEDTKKKIGASFKRDISKLSLLDLPKRTIRKILHRAKAKCCLCEWNEGICDIHHVIWKKNGGSNNADNLIVVCPNCHSIIHASKEINNFKQYDIEYLKQFVISKTFINWRDFYYASKPD